MVALVVHRRVGEARGSTVGDRVLVVVVAVVVVAIAVYSVPIQLYEVLCALTLTLAPRLELEFWKRDLEIKDKVKSFRCESVISKTQGEAQIIYLLLRPDSTRSNRVGSGQTVMSYHNGSDLSSIGSKRDLRG